jgi:hypothetical protein
MRSVLLVTAMAASVAAALAPGVASGQPMGTSGIQHHKVVIIGNRYVVVDQQPIVVLHDNHVGKIFWELPPKPSRYRFHDDGIAIDQDQFLGCRPLAGGFKFECVDRMPRGKKLYPYRITVYGLDSKTEPLTADASVQND